MRKTLMVLGLAALAAATAGAAVNDVGIPAQSGPALAPGQPVVLGATCPPAGTVSTAFSGANTQSGRIFRDAIASACPSKVYPGIFNVGTTYNYESFTYPNTGGAAACVTVNFDPDTVGASPCSTNAHASAYLNTYDPNNQATNFLGDVGSSIAQPFSFEIPAGNSMVLVVTNTSAQATCTFGFEVVNLPCTTAVEAELSLSKSVSPATVPPGGNATFSLTVHNYGPGDAANTVVTDTLPSGLTYVSNNCGATFTPPALTWSVGTLVAAASATCDVTVTVDQPGSFVNSALASSDGTDAVPANNTAAATVTGQVNIVEVPTLSAAGIALMLLGLGLAAVWVLRRN